MRVILIGGGETFDTLYYVARHLESKGYQLTIVTPYPDEAKTLSQRLEATVLLGNGSDPAVLEQAGARRADVVLSLTAHDPDNLVACQIAHRLYGVPRTVALTNDPDNESVFRRLGISTVFAPARIIGRLIEAQTSFEQIASLTAVAEGRVHVTEVVLQEDAPAVGKTVAELGIPYDCLVATILRGGEVIVPRGDQRLQVGDRLIVITLPESQGTAIRILTGGNG